jgi:hypothetical protein
MLRFLYINLYAFLLAFTGILTLAVPLFLISKWFIIPQIIIAIFVLSTSIKLFSTWKDKLREIDLLVNRNKNEFRPDTFEIYMQAPCGRLVVRQALKKLNKQDEFKELLKLKKPFFQSCRENLVPVKTVIYIKEDAL